MKQKLTKHLFFLLIVVFVMFGCVSQRTLSSNESSINVKTNNAISLTNKETRRKELYALLGKLPDRHRPISAKLISREETDEMITEKLLFDFNGFELVPAYFTKPKNSKGKIPVILFNHSHFGEYEVGKKEFVNGRKEMQKPPYAVALAPCRLCRFMY